VVFSFLGEETTTTNDGSQEDPFNVQKFPFSKGDAANLLI
jgi:hypothetical protein